MPRWIPEAFSFILTFLTFEGSSNRLLSGQTPHSTMQDPFSFFEACQIFEPYIQSAWARLIGLIGQCGPFCISECAESDRMPFPSSAIVGSINIIMCGGGSTGGQASL